MRKSSGYTGKKRRVKLMKKRKLKKNNKRLRKAGKTIRKTARKRKLLRVVRSGRFKKKRRRAGRKKIRRGRRSRRLQVQVQVEQALPNVIGERGGANLIGFVRAEIGLGEAIRLAGRALERAEVPFCVIDVPIGVPSSDMTLAHKQVAEPHYHANLVYINPESLMHIRQQLGEHRFTDRFNIGYWHWELPEMRQEDVGMFSLVNEVWVPTSFVQNSFAPQSPVPVVRMPQGIELEVTPGINRQTFGLPEDRFLFLVMYDVKSNTTRKNPQAAVEAFKLAFGPDDPNVGLVLKINNGNAENMQAIMQLTQGYSNIYIIDRVISRLEVNSLLNCTDCFVSLHRSEGFGLGLAEAMYLGKPVIGTNWSGNTDFMNTGNSCLVDYDLVEVVDPLGAFVGQAHQRWAEARIDHAAAYMRELVLKPEWRDQMARNGMYTIRTQFSPQVVGNMIKQRLIELGLM